MPIRAANIENSDRLRRVLALLADGNWHGTWEISRVAGVCAVNSIISELRHEKNGFDIATRCVGRGRYEYQLER